MSWPRHTSFRRDFSRTVRGFRICLAAHFADPFAAAMSRQRRGGRRRRQTMDFAAHVRRLAGAAGSAVSSIGFPRAAEMIKNDSDRRCARISVQSAIASLICEINENDFCVSASSADDHFFVTTSAHFVYNEEFVVAQV